MKKSNRTGRLGSKKPLINSKTESKKIFYIAPTEESSEGLLDEIFPYEELISEKIEDFSMQKRIYPYKPSKMDCKLSNFIVKNKNPREYQAITIRRNPDKTVYKSCSPLRDPNITEKPKYLIHNPFRQKVNHQRIHDESNDSIYTRKQINNYYVQITNSEIGNSIAKTILNKSEDDIHTQKYYGVQKRYPQGNTFQPESPIFTLKRKIYRNNNEYTNIASAISYLNNLFLKKSKRRFFKKFKRTKVRNPKVRREVRISLSKFGDAFSKEGTFEEEIEETLIENGESFQIIPKKNAKITKVTKPSKNKNLEAKLIKALKNKIITNLIKIKYQQRKKELNKYFNIYFKKTSIFKVNLPLILACDTAIQNKKSELKKLILINFYHRKKNLKTYFNNFRFAGLMREINEVKKSKEELEEKWRLQKLLEDKAKERKNLLRKAFNRYYMNCISVNLKQAFEKEKLRREAESKEKRERKICKFIMIKYAEFVKYLHGQFMKFYYRGLYRKMVSGKMSRAETLQEKPSVTIQLPKAPKPQLGISKTVVEKTKEVEKGSTNQKRCRDLRKFISNKVKHNKEILKIYFFKFYYAGVVKTIRKTKEKYLEKEQRELEKTMPQSEKGKYQKKVLKKLTSKEEAELRKKEEAEMRMRIISSKVYNVLYKKYRVYLLILKSKFGQWNIKSKIIRLKMMKKKKKVKKGQRSCRSVEPQIRKKVTKKENIGQKDQNEEKSDEVPEKNQV